MPSLAVALPPPFREGDRLNSAEFLRRWEAAPELKHAELIDGIVYCIPSPLSLAHSDPHYTMNAWLWLYTEATPGCQGGPEATWVMGPADVTQPDVYLRIRPEHGGQSCESRSYGAGAPELIVEVSGSTYSRDLGAKLEVYRNAGVREYITVLLTPQRVIWRQLVRGRYREIPAGDDGLLRSSVFPGLWLDPEAVWSKRKSMRTALERGLKSAEHAAFVKRLAAARSSK